MGKGAYIALAMCLVAVGMIAFITLLTPRQTTEPVEDNSPVVQADPGPTAPVNKPEVVEVVPAPAETPPAPEPEEIPVPRSGECASGVIWPTLADLDRLGLGMKDFVETCENRLLDEALAESGGVRSRAASRLGIKRTTLIERLRRRGEKDEPAR